ncbi:MAG: hypothetical protein J6T18_05665 [Bacteroidaceae bacterium]|nr:hypothetical protein [Bacteroidaceae bacterium]MBO7588895.1 hypothetical protein [Bacteroidaceae bacterium]
MIKRVLLIVLVMLLMVIDVRAEGIACSSDDIGKILGADGMLYMTVNEANAAGATPIGMVASIDLEHKTGLAVALTDAAESVNWEEAVAAAKDYTPAVSFGSWRLPTRQDWENMFICCGDDPEYKNDVGIFSCTGFAGKYRTAVDNLKSRDYFQFIGWTATENDESTVCGMIFIFLENVNYGHQAAFFSYAKTETKQCRPVLSFDINTEHVVTLAPECDPEVWNISPSVADENSEVTIKYTGPHKIKGFEGTNTLFARIRGDVLNLGTVTMPYMIGLSGFDGMLHRLLRDRYGYEKGFFPLTIDFDENYSIAGGSGKFFIDEKKECLVINDVFSGFATLFGKYYRQSPDDPDCLLRKENCRAFTVDFYLVNSGFNGILPVLSSDTTYTFRMPGRDVEVSPLLYYALDEEAADNETAYGDKRDVYIKRSFRKGEWDTFAVPFNISKETMDDLGFTAKQLVASSYADGVVTLSFADAGSIEAGKPYLVKVDEDIENPVFEYVTQDYTVNTVSMGVANFVPTLEKTLITGCGDNADNAKSVLLLDDLNNLISPMVVNNPDHENSYINAFHAYFQLSGDAVSAREFILDFNLGVGNTGVNDLTGQGMERVRYSLDGRSMDSQSAPKEVFIENGRMFIRME